MAKAVKICLSTGCAESAAQVVCLEDVPDLNVCQLLQRMSEAGEDEVASLNKEDLVSNLMGEIEDVIWPRGDTNFVFEC